ncbi:hypothetical protein L873DRAFT_1786340 [Choiromyces venosus 120613-1]|uniref:Uncharacterized protein n=1 Tax=Choiromyces venosus 120613-1 TaxID=1336337 RepID=A0A3N4K2L9_9PEZI|nr:hypothetical protein L873DRAFT_1786340 [Choiromyces venosus 120613-1]
MQMFFTSKSLLSSKSDISTPSHSPAPAKYVTESPRCQLSNGASPVLLASVPARLQAASHLLAPIRYVPEFPRCYLSNGTCHILRASRSAELPAAMQLAFISEFLLTLKTDISTLSHSLAPIRHVPESPRCQLSNGASHILLASCSAELQAAMQLAFIGEFLLTLKTDISTLSHSPAPIR